MKITTLLLAIFALVGFATAKTTDITVKTNMHCDACKTKIGDKLKTEAGVNATEIDLAAKTVKVTYDDDTTNPETIKKSISSLGFSADEVKAEAKSCDTKSGKCCSTEKKAKKVKKS